MGYPHQVAVTTATLPAPPAPPTTAILGQQTHRPSNSKVKASSHNGSGSSSSNNTHHFGGKNTGRSYGKLSNSAHGRELVEAENLIRDALMSNLMQTQGTFVHVNDLVKMVPGSMGYYNEVLHFLNVFTVMGLAEKVGKDHESFFRWRG